MPMVPTSAIWSPLACSCIYGLIWSLLWSAGRARDLGSGLYDIQAPPKGDSCNTTVPLGHPLRTMVKGSLPSGKTSSRALSCSFCLEGEKAKHAILCWFMGCANGLFGWSENWKEDNWKIGDKEIWEGGMLIGLFEQGTCEDIYVPCECLPKGDLSRGGFYFVLNVYLFLRERERESEQGRAERETGKEIPKQVPQCQPRDWRRARSHEPWDGDPSGNQESDA